MAYETRSKSKMDLEKILKAIADSQDAMAKKIQNNSEELKAGLLQRMDANQEEMKNNSEELKAGLIETMEARQEAMVTKLEAEIKVVNEDLKTKMDSGFDNMERTIDNLEKNLETTRKDLEAKVDKVEKEIKNDVLEIKNDVVKIEDDVLTLKERIEGLEQGKIIQPIEKQIDEILGKKVEELKISDCIIKTENSLSSPKVKPPTYDGTYSWSNYLRQFTTVAEINGWSEKEKASSLIVSLRGAALEILQIVPVQKQDDYQLLIENMERRFGDKRLEHVYRTQFRTRKQHVGETVHQYGAEITRLSKLAYPNVPDEVLEEMATDMFIEGVRDVDMHQSLRMGRPKTLGDAISYALEFEAAKQSSNKYFMKSRQVNVRNADNEMNKNEVNTVSKFKEALIELCSRFSDETKNQEERPIRRPLRCYNCQKTGHLKRQCTLPPRGAGENRYPSENEE